MTLVDIFGDGKAGLTALQMGARALVLFFVTLVLVRLAGMRAFGRKSSFDTVVAVTFGAVMSRAIAGVSPAIPTVAAATVLALLHRAIGMVTAAVPALERIIKGASEWVYRGGLFNLPRMHRAGISRADIEEAVRKRANGLSLRDVLEVRLESNGELTVVQHA
jgi:uncharacterized membrane protein YcaP (DUF421 family)